MVRKSIPVLVLMVVGSASLVFWRHGMVMSSQVAQRTFVFNYSATVSDLPADAGTLKLWLPLPRSDAHQTISNLTITSPYPYQTGSETRFGNSILFIEVHQPEVSSFNVGLRFEVMRKEYRRALPSSQNKQPASTAGYPPGVRGFLDPDHLVPTSGKIRDLALKVTEGKTTPLAKARAIYDYVTWNLTYDKSGTGWGRGDAVWACDAKHGNCTDFHSLFIGMARSVGIPAKFEIGFPLPENQNKGEIGGYHCWAEFYIDGMGWIPVDSSEASKNKQKADYFFGALDINRVQFTQGRDLELAPPQDLHPLNYFIYPYAELDGKEFVRIDRKFSYEDSP